MDLSHADIIQIDATVIIGVLFLLSLTAIDKSQITGITATIIFPFAISAIVVLAKHEKFGTRLMVTGFFNLMISIILLSIIIIQTGNASGANK